MKVLDLTQYVAGPFCTKLLADYGAEVLKVERPGQGDPGRRLGPFPNDSPHPDTSGLFRHLNGNKLGVTLDLKHTTGVKIFEELVRWADVVVESFRPGVMAGFGLSYSRLSEVHPGVILTSISNFGQTGPYKHNKATEIIEYAIGGPMLFTGTSSREPLKLGGRVGMIFAGQEAATATLMAFYRSMGRQDAGEHVDVSIMETQAGSIDRQTALLLNYQYTGNRFSRLDASEAYLGGVYPAHDGNLDVQVIERFTQLLAGIGQPDTITPSEAVVLTQFLDKWENADGNPLESKELIRELGIFWRSGSWPAPWARPWPNSRGMGLCQPPSTMPQVCMPTQVSDCEACGPRSRVRTLSKADSPVAIPLWSVRRGNYGGPLPDSVSIMPMSMARCSDTTAETWRGYARWGQSSSHDLYQASS